MVYQKRAWDSGKQPDGSHLELDLLGVLLERFHERWRPPATLDKVSVERDGLE
jgi:hypothetical protein